MGEVMYDAIGAPSGEPLTISVLSFLRALDRNRNRLATKFNITVSELRALSRVAEPGNMTPKRLAESMGMTTGAVTAISNRLVALEMLVRVPHPNDRRSHLLKLTPAAEQIMNLIFEDSDEVIARSASHSSPEDRLRLGALLTEMALVISAHADQAVAVSPE
jgi:DNA-binding MarR family transcriptional regulator